MTTNILPHQTAEGPQDRAAWEQLLATAPRSTDSVGRATIQVCTASDGRAIFATVEYATWQTEKEEGCCPPNAAGSSWRRMAGT